MRLVSTENKDILVHETGVSWELVAGLVERGFTLLSENWKGDFRHVPNYALICKPEVHLLRLSILKNTQSSRIS